MIRYYLFGGQAVETFENEGAKSMVSEKDEYTIDYQLYQFDSSTQNVNDLLLNYSGWDNFIELSKAEYDEIIELELTTI